MILPSHYIFLAVVACLQLIFSYPVDYPFEEEALGDDVDEWRKVLDHPCLYSEDHDMHALNQERRHKPLFYYRKIIMSLNNTISHFTSFIDHYTVSNGTL